MIRYLQFSIFIILIISLPAVMISPALGAAVYMGELANLDNSDNLCIHPANPVVAENCLPGTTDWQVKNYTDQITGFASAASVSPGENLDFRVDTSVSHFDLEFYRLGYYQGSGGRRVSVVKNIAGTRQPPCRTDISTGLVSCSNWSSSYQLKIPQQWTSGVYWVKMVLQDNEGQGYMIFVVRDDNRPSDILYQQSVTTYQAYNNYGGKSVYSRNSGQYCLTVTGASRAAKVSFDRPYHGAPDDPAMFFRAEYPLVRWMEAQGYDVTYSTNLDTHLSGEPNQTNLLLRHRIFISAGHDEYWSQEMRDAMTAARDAGVNLGFFSGNTGYWQMRMEPDPWTGEHDRVMAVYKTVESGSPDPSGTPTSTWRDPAGAANPENGLVGVQYVGDNDTRYFPLRISAEQAADRIYRNTGLQGMPPGTYVEIGKELVGWEWDAVVDNGSTPAGLTVLSASPTYGEILQDAGKQYKVGSSAANSTRYIAPSGALVFSSGTIQWSWGLELREPDPLIQQITYNLFSDMGVQPATPVPTLVLDTKETNITAALPSESPIEIHKAGDSPVLLIEGVNSQVNGQSAAVTWKTNVPSMGEIWLVNEQGEVTYIETGEGGSSIQWEYTQDHTLTLDGLKPGRLYHYQVTSTSNDGQTIISPVAQLKTTGAAGIENIDDWSRRMAAPFVCRARPAGREILYILRSNPLVLGVMSGLLVGLILGGAWVRTRRRQ